jgi:hypothetical protein
VAAVDVSSLGAIVRQGESVSATMVVWFPFPLPLAPPNFGVPEPAAINKNIVVGRSLRLFARWVRRV